MTEPTYSEPKLAINKVYTKTGDKGKTSLVGGQRVNKDDLRIEAYGTVDELNAFLGSVAVSVANEMAETPERTWFLGVIHRVQHELFNLGSILATLPQDMHPKQPQVRAEDIAALERDIDQVNDDLPKLRSFVLPGASRSNTDLHLCRTVCRRAERILIHASRETQLPQEAIAYLNRLSDAFFVWSRWVNVVLQKEEVLWEPNKAASASQK